MHTGIYTVFFCIRETSVLVSNTNRIQYVYGRAIKESLLKIGQISHKKVRFILANMEKDAMLY